MKVIDINAGHHVAVLEVGKLRAQREARRWSGEIRVTAGPSFWTILGETEIEDFCGRGTSPHGRCCVSGCLRSVGMLGELCLFVCSFVYNAFLDQTSLELPMELKMILKSQSPCLSFLNARITGVPRLIYVFLGIKTRASGILENIVPKELQPQSLSSVFEGLVLMSLALRCRRELRPFEVSSFPDCSGCHSM